MFDAFSEATKSSKRRHSAIRITEVASETAAIALDLHGHLGRFLCSTAGVAC